MTHGKDKDKPSIKLVTDNKELDSTWGARNTIKPGTVRTPVLPNGLTVKQETFARLVAKGASYVDAYRESHDSINSNANTLHNSASKLASNPKVKDRIEQIQYSIEQDKHRVATSDANRWHTILWSIAEEGKNDASRVAALRELGKALGITDASKADNTTQKNSADILKDIQAKLAKVAGDK